MRVGSFGYPPDHHLLWQLVSGISTTKDGPECASGEICPVDPGVSLAITRWLRGESPLFRSSYLSLY